MKTQQLPYLLRIPERGLALADGSLLPEPQVPLELRSTGKPVEIERMLLAYRIPYLPDLLSSSNLAGNERECLAEVLERQALLTANLGKWKGMAFALRFFSQPGHGEVEIALVARAISRSDRGLRLGEQVGLDVAALLTSFDYPVEPVNSEAELRTILEPVIKPFIVEIRQHEEVLSMIQGDAYVVYPFCPSLTTWISPFRTLLEQRSPCVVSVYLEPTDVHPFERDLFAQAAQLAETLSEWTFEGLAYRSRLADPVARIVARFYANYLQRFTSPFLMTVQVGSTDPMIARNVAQALAVEVTETRTFAEAIAGSASLPSGFDLAVPETDADLQAARRTLAALDLLSWGWSEATEGKERLRYLVDARTASAAFRFPVPIRGGVPGVRTRQPAPSYDVGPRPARIGADELFIGTFSDRGGMATVPLAYLNRHALVAGTTGSGKTTTCLSMLLQLWEKGIPFLVIEPAKAEYRVLLQVLGHGLFIFTLGDESISPFRLNPLEVQPGVRVETHLSAVAAAINAAIPTFGVLPTLIEQALERLYLDKGWNPMDRAQPDERRLYPTLGELYHEIIRVAEERGYSDRTMQDIRGAAAGRIGSLLRGSKGRALNILRSVPMDELMATPTILELQSLTDEEKALVMMFLLTMIYEHCRVHRGSATLQHVTVVEEAHRVMTAVPHQADRETAADARAEAVGLFSNLLSEVRAYGEGLLIAEQIPTRLAQDALKNTNVKIIHRLPGEDDRNAIGATMRMDDRQRDHVAGLSPGRAAFFANGLERPTFIEVPDVRREQGLPERVSDVRVEAHMRAFRDTHQDFYLPFAGCLHCQCRCQYRDRVGSLAYDIEASKAFRKALYAFEQHLRAGDESNAWVVLAGECSRVLAAVGLAHNPDAVYCYFAHHWGRNVKASAVQRLRSAIQP
jgi:hypothetical protein